MESEKLNKEHEILRRFMAVVVSSAFRDELRQHVLDLWILKLMIATSSPALSLPISDVAALPHGQGHELLLLLVAALLHNAHTHTHRIEPMIASQVAWHRMENGPKAEKNGRKHGRKRNGPRRDMGQKMAK